MFKDGLPRFAHNLNNLFEATGYSNREMSAELVDLGLRCTSGYLTLLRQGQKTNPAATLVAGLTLVFQRRLPHRAAGDSPFTALYWFDAEYASTVDEWLEPLKDPGRL